MTKMKKNTYEILLTGFLFLLTVPVIAHLVFSAFGYNPTDDGFTLSYARRILEGQVPHRDFIIIRPFLSPLLHTPVVWLAGENMYWVSRLIVWFQMAWISLCGVLLLRRSFAWLNHPINLFLLAVASFAFTATTWPIMAWHTIDGLMFLVTGFLLIGLHGRVWRYSGFFLIGAACLCKQSFALALPLSLCITGYWRDWKAWVSTFMACAFYGLFVVTTGSFSDTLIQFMSHTSLALVFKRIIMSLGTYAFLSYIA
ncbi:MAG: hypothetical protein GX811_12395 [Lentisphaerae bacterium]|nr:hypothetical protein [Lentisphaerota bacterium]